MNLYYFQDKSPFHFLEYLFDFRSPQVNNFWIMYRHNVSVSQMINKSNTFKYTLRHLLWHILFLKKEIKHWFLIISLYSRYSAGSSIREKQSIGNNKVIISNPSLNHPLISNYLPRLLCYRANCRWRTGRSYRCQWTNQVRAQFATSATPTTNHHYQDNYLTIKIIEN